MSDQPTLLVFAASGGATEVEQMVVRLQWAIGVDLIEQALSAGLCERVIVASGAAGFLDQVASLPVIVERDDGDFHFGRRLQSLITRYGIARPLYAGAGSTALLSRDELAAICGLLSGADRALIANNFWSCDFLGFTPGKAIDLVEAPLIDNNLAFLLNRKAGLAEITLPRTAGTQFDVDTPTDALILSLHPRCAGHARLLLDKLSLDTARLQAVSRLLVDEDAEIVVCGRVGSAAWLHLERDTACRVRLFSEERGMRASGREHRGEARSLLGFYLRSSGARGLFDALSELGNAAIVDSRVVFAHLGLILSPADRYYSDLLMPEHILDPVAREFTAAARDARIPVVLGGHSLVSGGLWGLVDAAWQRKDSRPYDAAAS